MATPLYEQGLTLEDVLELSADELRKELAGREIDAKRNEQSSDAKGIHQDFVSGCASSTSSHTASFTTHCFESTATHGVGGDDAQDGIRREREREQRLRFESEALERKERKEAEASEKRERREEQDRQALEKKEAIEREEKAEALKKQEKQEAIERQQKAEALEKKERQDAEALERKYRIEDEERQKKEKREAIEEDRKVALLERKLEAEETANKIKLDFGDRKIRENRAIEEFKLKMELEKLEMDDKEKARQHEINLKRLDQNLPVVSASIPNDGFRLSGAIKFVPPFDDVDMTQFLNAFEKAMAIHKFPKDKWTQLI